MVNLLWQSPRTPSPNLPLHFMVHRSIVCPINDFVVYTHVLHITVFETHLYIYPAGTWRLNQRFINISLTSSWSHVPAGYLFIFTRHRQRGTIVMTLICLFVHLSILHSIRLSVRPIFFHNYNSSYIFHWTDLKFYRLPSYRMKMCRWFLVFFRQFFTKLWPLLTHTLSRQLLPHLLSNWPKTLLHDLKMCMWFRIFSFLIFDKVMALCHFWHFSNFWTP